jgi:DNA repair exonuclease SbcCD ATPase subunit
MNKCMGTILFALNFLVASTAFASSFEASLEKLPTHIRRLETARKELKTNYEKQSIQLKNAIAQLGSKIESQEARLNFLQSKIRKKYRDKIKEAKTRLELIQNHLNEEIEKSKASIAKEKSGYREEMDILTRQIQNAQNEITEHAAGEAAQYTKILRLHQTYHDLIVDWFEEFLSDMDLFNFRMQLRDLNYWEKKLDASQTSNETKKASILQKLHLCLQNLKKPQLEQKFRTSGKMRKLFQLEKSLFKNAARENEHASIFIELSSDLKHAQQRATQKWKEKIDACSAKEAKRIKALESKLGKMRIDIQRDMQILIGSKNEELASIQSSATSLKESIAKKAELSARLAKLEERFETVSEKSEGFEEVIHDACFQEYRRNLLDNSIQLAALLGTFENTEEEGSLRTEFDYTTSEIPYCKFWVTSDNDHIYQKFPIALLLEGFQNAGKIENDKGSKAWSSFLREKEGKKHLRIELKYKAKNSANFDFEFEFIRNQLNALTIYKYKKPKTRSKIIHIGNLIRKSWGVFRYWRCYSLEEAEYMEILFPFTSYLMEAANTDYQDEIEEYLEKKLEGNIEESDLTLSELDEEFYHESLQLFPE